MGVPVFFADEELLSSNERHWDQLVDEAKAAESWLRKHRRRVKEGLAAKLATKRDPGGRPPYGFRRNADKLMEPDPDKLSTVRRVFELSAAGDHRPGGRRRGRTAAVHRQGHPHVPAVSRQAPRWWPRQLAARRGPSPGAAGARQAGCPCHQHRASCSRQAPVRADDAPLRRLRGPPHG